MIHSLKLTDLLKFIQGKADVNSQIADKNQAYQNKNNDNQVPKFNTGELDSTKEWGGMISFSETAQNEAKVDNKAGKISFSQSISDFLKSFNEQIKINTDIPVPTIPTQAITPTVPTVPTTPTVPTVPTTPTVPTVPTTPTVPTVPTTPTEPTIPTPTVEPVIVIPPGKRGSVEYAAKLLGEDNVPGIENKDIVTNKYGQVIQMASYSVTDIEVVDPSGNGFQHIKEEKLMYTCEIEYLDNGNTKITKVDSNSVVTVLRFDANGNEIKDIPVIPAGEIGSMEYALKLLGKTSTEGFFLVNKDYMGRVIEFIESYNDLLVPKPINIEPDAPTMSPPIYYYVSYADNGEISIKRDANNGEPIETKTFDKDGKLIKVVTRTTIYPEKHVVEETNMANGSWDKTVIDEYDNIVSKEGKVVLNKGYEYVGDIKLTNNEDKVSEVKYFMNSNKEMVINANYIEISPRKQYPNLAPGMNGLASPEYYDIPLSNLTIKGNNNVITGSVYDDSVKVVGNNNKIDLKAGYDTIKTIGNNNSVKNAENVSIRGNEIPEGEIGSLMYIWSDLLGMTSGGLNEITKDDEGRVVYFYNLEGNGKKTKYYIGYADNGEVTVNIQNVSATDMPLVTKVFDANKKLIREIEESQLKEVIKNYYDWGTDTITTVKNNEGKPVSLIQKYETDTYNTVFKEEYSYHTNGNVASILRTEIINDLQLQKITTTFDENNLKTGERGEITLRENEGRWFSPVVIHNSSNKIATYYYSIDKNNKVSINASGLEFSPISYSFGYNPGPIKMLDYTTGITVDVNNQDELNNLIEKNNVIFNPKRLYKEQKIDNIEINGNNNIINGSYNDDNISVFGNYNNIDLKDGNDKLNVVGYNNRVYNVEEISSALPQSYLINE